MKKFFVVSILLVFNSISAFAQPDTLWTRVIGEADFHDGATDVQQTSDGGFIVTGGTASFGAVAMDVYLFKLNSSGDPIWSTTFANGSMSMSSGFSVKQTSDGGYIVLGQSYVVGSGTGFDAILVKTDANGNEEWFQSYDGGDDELAYEVELTPDGGYVFVGGQCIGGDYSDGWLVKTDADGNVTWEQRYGGIEDDVLYAFDQTSDGGYIMFGMTLSFGLADNYMWMVKADADGNEEWNQTFGGGSGEWGYKGVQTSDGGYIIVGYTNSYSTTGTDAWLVKTDADGNEEWSQNYGGQYDDYGFSVIQTADGGYIVGGNSPSFSAGGDVDIWVFKTDADGVELWSQTYGGTMAEECPCVALTSDNGYIIAGMTESFGDEEGDAYLVRLEGDGTMVEDFGNHSPSEFVLDAPYPNPFNASTAISFKVQAASRIDLGVYDILGRRVWGLGYRVWDAGNHSVAWDAEGCASGVYFIQLIVDGRRSMVNSEQQKATRKVVLVK